MRTIAVDLRALLFFLAEPVASETARGAPARVCWLRGGRWARLRTTLGDIQSHTAQAGKGVSVVRTDVL